MTFGPFQLDARPPSGAVALAAESSQSVLNRTYIFIGISRVRVYLPARYIIINNNVLPYLTRVADCNKTMMNRKLLWMYEKNKSIYRKKIIIIKTRKMDRRREIGAIYNIVLFKDCSQRN